MLRNETQKNLLASGKKRSLSTLKAEREALRSHRI